MPEVALARRARSLWAYWRAERRTRRQGLIALVLSTLASFVAGLTLGAITGTLEEFPGLFILIPASVGMRGVISGTTGARLGTSIAAGVFEDDGEDPDDEFAFGLQRVLDGIEALDRTRTTSPAAASLARSGTGTSGVSGASSASARMYLAV